MSVDTKQMAIIGLTNMAVVGRGFVKPVGRFLAPILATSGSSTNTARSSSSSTNRLQKLAASSSSLSFRSTPRRLERMLVVTPASTANRTPKSAPSSGSTPISSDDDDRTPRSVDMTANTKTSPPVIADRPASPVMVAADAVVVLSSTSPVPISPSIKPVDLKPLKFAADCADCQSTQKSAAGLLFCIRTAETETGNPIPLPPRSYACNNIDNNGGRTCLEAIYDAIVLRDARMLSYVARITAAAEYNEDQRRLWSIKSASQDQRIIDLESQAKTDKNRIADLESGCTDLESKYGWLSNLHAKLLADYDSSANAFNQLRQQAVDLLNGNDILQQKLSESESRAESHRAGLLAYQAQALGYQRNAETANVAKIAAEAGRLAAEENQRKADAGRKKAESDRKKADHAAKTAADTAADAKRKADDDIRRLVRLKDQYYDDCQNLQNRQQDDRNRYDDQKRLADEKLAVVDAELRECKTRLVDVKQRLQNQMDLAASSLSDSKKNGRPFSSVNLLTTFPAADGILKQYNGMMNDMYDLSIDLIDVCKPVDADEIRRRLDDFVCAAFDRVDEVVRGHIQMAIQYLPPARVPLTFDYADERYAPQPPLTGSASSALLVKSVSSSTATSDNKNAVDDVPSDNQTHRLDFAEVEESLLNSVRVRFDRIARPDHMETGMPGYSAYQRLACLIGAATTTTKSTSDTASAIRVATSLRTFANRFANLAAQMVLSSPKMAVVRGVIASPVDPSRFKTVPSSSYSLSPMSVSLLKPRSVRAVTRRPVIVDGVVRIVGEVLI